MQHNKAGEQKLFRLFGHFSAALLLTISTLSAESFANFKRGQQSSFAQYKDAHDTAFAKHLSEQWGEFDAYKTPPLYENEKPKNILPAKEEPSVLVGPTVYITLKDIAKEIPKKQSILEKKDINFTFFGTQLSFFKPAKIDTARFFPQNQEGITNFFHTLASSDSRILVDSIKRAQEDLVLNDWGVYLLVKKISDTFYSDADESRLMSWYLFNKLGYATKVGLAAKRVVLMHRSKKIIYATPSYTINGQKYYALHYYNTNAQTTLKSYEQNYPEANKALDLELTKLPLFDTSLKTKRLEFTNFSDRHSIEYPYNQNLIDFLSTYPQVDYETFFNAPIEPQSIQALSEGLKKIIDGKKASEAMNLVLRFVQNAFVYQRDQEQFGKEKVMFAQETLYYDRSDCEDRATLFALLIKELFGVGVVGVKYKDHMATALEIPLKGDKLILANKKYVIADPTYINANIGQSMPKYKSIQPQKFIVVQAR